MDGEINLLPRNVSNDIWLQWSPIQMDGEMSGWGP